MKSRGREESFGYREARKRFDVALAIHKSNTRLEKKVKNIMVYMTLCASAIISSAWAMSMFGKKSAFPMKIYGGPFVGGVLFGVGSASCCSYVLNRAIAKMRNRIQVVAFFSAMIGCACGLPMLLLWGLSRRGVITSCVGGAFGFGSAAYIVNKESLLMRTAVLHDLKRELQLKKKNHHRSIISMVSFHGSEYSDSLVIEKSIGLSAKQVDSN